MVTPAQRSARVKAHAREVGFDLVGVTSTAVPEAFSRYVAQMDAGYGAEMRWLTDHPERRADVREIHPPARSVVALAVSYASPQVPGYLAAPPAADEGWIARYAQGRDYHVYIKQLLVRLARRLADDPDLGHDSREHRVFVDTGPVLEKAFAQAAGLGWVGKNTLLLERHGLGSWVFLAVMLTPLELAPDTPETDHCGSCQACLDVCPTDAFPAPYVLDARRCIATWTIESPDPAAVIEPAALGQHVFGCDLCQEVCPWNRKVQPTRHAPLAPRPENVRPKLATLRGLDDSSFKARFPKSAVRRVNAVEMAATIATISARPAAPTAKDSV